MLRILTITACLLSGAVQAAECTDAIEARWTAATREDERGAQIIQREAKKGAKADKAAICKVARTVPNLLRAAREYYEACGPEQAQAAIATIQKHAETAAAFVETNCTEVRPAPPPARTPAAGPRPKN